MKKLLIMLLTLTMLVSMSGMIAISAYADDGEQPQEFWGTANQYCSWSLNERKGWAVLEVLTMNGSLPSGMYYDVDNLGRLIVSGTPSSAGTYRVNFSMTVSDSPDPNADGANIWGDSLAAIFHIEGGKREDYTLPDYFAQLNAGQQYWLPFDMDSAGFIDNYRLKSGNLPDGMYGDMDNSALYIAGIPTRAGDYYFTIAAHNYYYDCWVSQPICLSVTGSLAPVVTKNPTGETIYEGGSTSFIARADNVTKITWRLISPDSKTTIKASEAPGRFSGLQVSGTNAEQFNISNAPLSLDGWVAEAMFEGPGGTAYSNGAVIRVSKAPLKTPKIKSSPADAKLNPGESVTLTVDAVSPDGNKLTYQWYKTVKNGNYDGTAISGATSSSYTVNYEEGTFSYYCIVRNNRDGEVSDPISSSAAQVIGLPASSPTPAPSSAPTVSPSAQPTEAPKETAAPEKPAEKAKKADHTVAFIIGGVAAVALICATLVVVQRGAAKRYPDRFSEQIRRADEYRQSHHRSEDD